MSVPSGSENRLIKKKKESILRCVRGNDFCFNVAYDTGSFPRGKPRYTQTTHTHHTGHNTPDTTTHKAHTATDRDLETIM